MNEFLRQHEKRAFRMAYLATRNHDDALEIVQEAMIKLVQNYQHKEPALWKPLFIRIVQSKIYDWYRKEKVRSQWRSFWPFGQDKDEEVSLEEIHGDESLEPTKLIKESSAMQELEAVLQALPLRQQQAFLLRAWEGLSTRETAEAMGCSEGSVKTHFSRATQTIKDKLGEHWP